MKVIVAHPGRQHSFRLASALKKAGMLDLYVTTFYDKNTPANRAFRAMLPAPLRRRADHRRNPDLEDGEVVTIGAPGAVVEAAVYRLDHGRDLYRFVQRRNADRFGKKLAKLACARQADALVLYDSTATACFRALQRLRPETVRILDVSIGARPYQKGIFDREIARSGHDDLRVEKGMLWNERVMRRYREELALTDYFLAPSTFVRDSLIASGVDGQRILLVPYGFNFRSDIVRWNPSPDRPLSLLFVGRVSANKGVAILIEAMRQLPRDQVHLTVTGAYDPQSWFVRAGMAMENVTFTGLVQPQEMQRIYEQADVFVLPSLIEGMSLAGLEAMACALPIVCTDHTGVNDCVRDGENGFVIPAGDPQALAEKLQWCVDHRARLPEMGAAAGAAVSGLTWEAYEKRAAAAIDEILKRRRGRADG